MAIASPAPNPLPWTQRLLHHPWLDGQTLNYWLEQLSPSLSLIEPRARVTRIIEENHDTRSIELKPSWGWKIFQAGQHIGVSVEINGVRHRRRYSISSAPSTHPRDRFTITVKRQPGGKVSNALHDHVQLGDVLNLALPDGDFVLPAENQDKLLMLAAGSGLTPLMAQIEALLQTANPPQITLIHYIRSRADRLFEERLNILVEQHPELSVIWREEDQPQGRFEASTLQQDAPDFQQRHTLLCGPSGFMDVVKQLWAEEGLQDKLQFESFGAPITTTQGAGDVIAKVTLARSTRSLDIRQHQPALLALEAAGESPAYGCRQGICQSCRCRKLSGRTRNLISGEISQEPDVDIQLCITAAESDLVLDY